MATSNDTSYPSPRVLLAKYGLRAKKSWGQNFLGDRVILDEIARLAAPRSGERVVELGAGLGHLTARLVARGARVVAVERDRDMAEVLRGELGDRVTLLEADAVKVDYGRIVRELVGATPTSPSPQPSPPAHAGGEGAPAKLAVVGNLPYHLTSPILFSLLDQLAHLERAVFLVQREVAERLAARPGTHDWGILSVLLQREADVSIERIVPPGAFLPPPKVESAVLCAIFRAPAEAEAVADVARFRRLVKAGFAQRRKTLGNALRAARLADPAVLEAALARAGVDAGRRGETLSVAEWAALERALAAAGPAELPRAPTR
jgi:16S rRNA (adenine1518-N6/adenine1519-N6)-dimethyltransferase